MALISGVNLCRMKKMSTNALWNIPRGIWEIRGSYIISCGFKMWSSCCLIPILGFLGKRWLLKRSSRVELFMMKPWSAFLFPTWFEKRRELCPNCGKELDRQPGEIIAFIINDQEVKKILKHIGEEAVLLRRSDEVSVMEEVLFSCAKSSERLYQSKI